MAGPTEDNTYVPRCAPLLALTAVVMAGLGLAARAGAGDGQAVRLAIPNADALPFSPGELSAAVGLRAPVVSGTDAAVDAVDVDVTSAGAGWVEVASGPRRRRVEVSGVTGPDAARLVALIVVDLVRAEVPLPAAAAPMAVRGQPSTGEAAASRFALGATLGMGVRTTDAGIAFMPALEAQVDLARRARLVLSAAFERAEVVGRRDPSDGTLALTMFPVRLGAGLRLGWAELRAGALARVYIVSEWASYSGVVWGGFAALTAAWPTRGAVAGFGIVGLDFHPQGVAFIPADQPALTLTLHRLAPFVGVGAIFGSRG